MGVPIYVLTVLYSDDPSLNEIFYFFDRCRRDAKVDVYNGCECMLDLSVIITEDEYIPPPPGPVIGDGS